jgi:hypothetical protein
MAPHGLNCIFVLIQLMYLHYYLVNIVKIRNREALKSWPLPTLDIYLYDNMLFFETQSINNILNRIKLPTIEFPSFVANTDMIKMVITTVSFTSWLN